jgi:hypothetical protein
MRIRMLIIAGLLLAGSTLSASDFLMEASTQDAPAGSKTRRSSRRPMSAA